MSALKNRIKADLRVDEGVKKCVYKDHLGFWTIGVGRLVDERKRGAGLRPSEIEFMLDNDVDDRISELTRRLPCFAGLDEVRKATLINMSFQLGVDGLLGFVTTIRHLTAGSFAEAKKSMLQSLWAKQTPDRAARMAYQIETGLWASEA